MINKKIIGIGAIAAIVILAVFWIATINLDTDWTNSWNEDDTLIQGIWKADILVTYEDGSTESLNALENEPLAVYQTGESIPISTIIYTLSAKADGDFETCDLGFDGANTIYVILEQGTTNMKDTETIPATSNVIASSLVVNGDYIDVLKYEIPLSTIMDGYADDTYDIAVGLEGIVSYAGQPNGDTKTADPPGTITVHLTVIGPKVSLSFDGEVTINY